MALDFDNAGTGAFGDSIQLADHADLTFPDGDWTIGGWIYPDNRADWGTQHYFASWGGWGATPSLNWFIKGDVGDLAFIIEDSDGHNSGQVVGTTNLKQDEVWYHIILTRNGSKFEQYQDNTLDGDANVTNVDDVDRSDSFYLGARSDENVGMDFDGKLADWFCVDRALSSAERAALAGGASSRIVVPDAKWRLDMIRDEIMQKGAMGATFDTAGAFPHPPMRFPTRNQTVYFISSANVEVTVPVAALVLAGFAPAVATPTAITVPLATLTLAAFAPAVVVNTPITVPVATLTLAAFAPAVATPTDVTVPLATLTLAAFAPTVDVGSSAAVTVPLATLLLVAYAVTVAVTGAQRVATGTVGAHISRSATWSARIAGSPSVGARKASSDTWKEGE